ncbi:MAG TPA: type II CAAX endopeptidase family protein [Chloroflexota bacterium]
MPPYAYNVVVGAVALVAAAITVWTFAPAFRGPEAARRDVGSHRLAFGCIVAVLLLSTLASLPFVQDLRDAPFTLATFALAALATQIPLLLVLYVRLIWPRALSWQDLGLRPLPLEQVLRVGSITGISVLLLTIVVSLALSRLDLRPNQLEQYTFVRQAGIPGLIVVLVLVAVTAPIAEELFFRGFLFGVYRRRQPRWLAYAVSVAAFSIAHVMPTRMNPQQALGLVIAIVLLGTILTWTYERTGSLYPGMVAHAINNATGVLALYYVGST